MNGFALNISCGSVILLMEETGLPVIIAEDPLTCVARGGGRYLEMIDEFGTDILAVE